MMGYRKEDNPFLPPEHLRSIFNLAGIVNPAILLHGQVAGKWKENGRTINLTLFESIPPADRKRIEDTAARLFTSYNIIWT